MTRTQEEKKTLTIYIELAELIKIGIEQCRTSQQKSNQLLPSWSTGQAPKILLSLDEGATNL